MALLQSAVVYRSLTTNSNDAIAPTTKMHGFPALSEADEDPYAADGEGAAAATRVRRQRSSRNREFGLYASRLRQRPTTKRESASDLPSPAPRSANAANGADIDFDAYFDDDDDDNEDDYSTTANNHRLPASPVSPPRWASLASSTSFLFDQQIPADPSPSTKPSSRATSAASSFKFPGLSSHPFLPEPPTPDYPIPESPREHSTPTATRSPSLSSRPPSRKESASPTMLVENFSRPRKPSVRQNSHPYDAPSSRPRQAEPMHVEQSPSKSSWPRERARGLSISSGKSSATHASLPKRPSNDHIRPGRQPVTSAGVGVTSPGLSRPPLAYSRTDSGNGNGNGISMTGTHSMPRETLPWLADEELRSSYKSQLTASTTQGTTFTASGTERSSVLTKASSRTSVSLFPNRRPSFDEGLSVEDVMGMYEKGFYSTGGEDNDVDATNGGESTQSSGRTEQDDSQAESTILSGRNIGPRILEAMNDPLPPPNLSLHISEAGPHVVRDSGAFFRNSGLPGSESGGFDFGVPPPRLREIRVQDTEESTPYKRDSAKMLEHDAVVAVESRPSQRRILSPSRSQPALRVTAAVQRPKDEELPKSASDSTAPTLVAPEDASARDRYGFRKHNQYITREQYDAWDATYSEYLARRRRKWTAFMQDSGLMTDNPSRFPPPGPKTKRFIRKGVPPEWRGAAWFYYAQGPGILAKYPGVYDELVQRATVEGEATEVDVEAIERDLHRTFPDNIKFKFPDGHIEGMDSAKLETRDGEPKIITSLRRVLLAFSIYNPRIGYCQSLNFLAGLLLLFVETEEQCFWLLNVITQMHLPGTHETSLEGSKVDLGVLMAELRDSMPGIYAKVSGEMDDAPTPASNSRPGSKHGTLGRKAKRPKPTAPRSIDAASDRLPPVTLFMTAWFMSCFIGTLPIETTLRVWDVFFYEGSKTLFRVALGVFKLGESEIRSVSDPMEMFGVVQAIPRRLLDCNAVMEATFRRRNGFGHVSQESIENRRRERRETFRLARKAAATPEEGDAELLKSPVLGGLLDLTDGEGIGEIKRKGTLFGRRKEKRQPLDT
jgi:TBC1 domain family member 6